MRDRELVIKFRVGVFVLLLLLLFVAFVLTIGIQTRVFEAQYPLRAAFRDVQGLVVGAPVRLAGLSIGTVRRIGLSPDVADRRIHVEVSIDRSFQPRIREDSVATIGTIGLVGDKVFEITVGSESSKVLEPGAMLVVAEPVDFASLVSRGGEILDGLADAAQSLKRILSDETGGELVRDLGQLAKSLRAVSQEIEKGDGLLHALIFEDGGTEVIGRLRGSVAGLERVVERLEKGEGLLGALISDPAGAQIVQDLRALVADLRRIAAGLAEGEGTMGALLKDPTVYEDLSSLLRGAERSWVLRGLIRSGVRAGRDAAQEGSPSTKP
jgi:phospholipid/cholesterol/gamma-HCH transport system substrate-binding protein